ncbi:MAG: response regulator [Elusimicrobiota bacterium]
MPYEILVVDDDPLVGALSTDILLNAGYQTQLIRDSRMAIPAIQEHRPKLVVLDILMPGLDGLSLLHMIKNDPALSQTHVAVVSGKSFAPEIDRAMQYGAELFIQKPYDVKAFAQRIQTLIGPPAAPPAEGGAIGQTDAPKQQTAVKLRIWGRCEPGSTSVVSVEAMDTLFILDAGNGIVPLGQKMLEEGRFNRVWLLLSHYHTDHVCALGQFPCLRSKGFELHIAGPVEPAKNLATVLREEIQKSFSADPTPVTAKIKLHELREETYDVRPGLRIAPFYSNHPSTTLAYHLQLAGRHIILCPDCEIYGQAATALQDYDEKAGRICRNVDLLLHDARYNDHDYEAHKNEGHSGVSNVAEFAGENEVQRLVLFHQDPSYDDATLAAMEEQAKKLLDEKGAVIPCVVSRDGFELEF